MRHSLSRLKGFGLINIIVIGLLAGFCPLAAFKVGMPYGDQYLIQGIAVKALEEAHKNPVPEEEVAKRIFDRANVQSINLDYKLIAIERSGNELENYKAHIPMPVVIKLWKNASLHLDLGADVPPLSGKDPSATAAK